MFSRQSRQQLPRGVYDRILETNWMDVAMHKLALELSDELIKREEQKAPLPVRQPSPPTLSYASARLRRQIHRHAPHALILHDHDY